MVHTIAEYYQCGHRAALALALQGASEYRRARDWLRSAISEEQPCDRGLAMRAYECALATPDSDAAPPSH